MEFIKLPAEVREAQIARVMNESLSNFNHEVCAEHYIKIYEKMLQRPLVTTF
jgi:hypothetical protein